MTGTHTERESHPWAIAVADHPQRTESPEFRAAKAVAHKILATLTEYPFGPGPWQMHHGSSLWTFDGHGWFLLLGTVGIEWSGQWCADPAKVDKLRQLADRHYSHYPDTVSELTRLGYRVAGDILKEPITDAQGVARWTDGLFNSCCPMSAGIHQGVISAKNPGAGGQHHYPRPICDLQLIKREDFQLWVTDQKGRPVAVAPVAPRGSGDGRVEVVFATHGSQLHRQHHAAHAKGERLILPDDHPLAKQAFARQTG